MTEQELAALLSRAESETLDFKASAYDLQTSRSDFIKDLLAMANTPRDAPGHIVLGVQWTPESGATIVGLRSQVDDVKLQDALGSDRVQPRPRFTYTPLVVDGKSVGVVEVPVGHDGPYTALKDFGGLQAGVVIYRKGTQNDRALGPELRRIFQWFQSGEVGVPQCAENRAWSQLLDAVHHFEADTQYLLAADRLPATTQAPVHALGMLPWRAVIDFDPCSDASGLLGAMGPTLSHTHVIHRVVRGEIRVQSDRGTTWFFAMGLEGRQGTVAQDSHKNWLRMYKQELGQQLMRIAQAVSPSPLISLILWSDIERRAWLRTLIEELHGAFGERGEIVVVSDTASLEVVAEEAGATFVRVGLRALCSGVAVQCADSGNDSSVTHVLPTPTGAPIEIGATDWLWLSEDLDLLYRAVGTVGEGDAAEYRRGGTISWRNLHFHHDCERVITASLRSQVEEDLRRRQTLRVNLYHAPGGGGTSVGHRVAWDLRGTYPVALLRRCEPRDTAERIGRVATLTENSVLVLVDGANHAERDVDDLYTFLRANQTPAVLLQVLRRFSRQATGKRQFFLDAYLEDAEADRFRDAYSQAVPSRSSALTQLARRQDRRLRTAFFFGLVAFGREFRGLQRYVDERMVALTDAQRRILVYVAIGHYYGQQSIPAQAFAALLGFPQSRSLRLPAAFEGTGAQALDLLVEDPRGEWRTVHSLVALEILEQALAPRGTRDRESVWRQRLSEWGKEYAEFCRGTEQATSDRLLELARRVFIYRDNIEVLGTERAAQAKFSQLVEDIPIRAGRLEVLRHLTQCFPSEAHFQAHLGRALAHNGDYAEALQAVDAALALQPVDHVLHHMKGMVLRRSLKAAVGNGGTIEQLIAIAQEASVSFEESRRISPDLEHGYISEVQMLIDLLDAAGGGSKSLVCDVLSQPHADPFLQRALEKAENLLEQVRHLNAGEQLSNYAVECGARLQRLYGDFQTALQAWDRLLVRPDIGRVPIRRQIVWTILQRHDGKWRSLSRNENQRVVKLLEENLDEAVSDSSSLRLWLHAVRQSQKPPTLDYVIEKVSYWKTNTGVLDAAYYIYVLHTLRALRGSSQSAADAERALEECRALARFRRDRTRSFEWIGSGDGIGALVHQSHLGEWREDFWEHSDVLARIEGRICSIDGPQKGWVELRAGIPAFFVPAKAGVHRGRDENALVSCYIGFSYDGARAWGVQPQ